jgi:hypothetical protein
VAARDQRRKRVGIPRDVDGTHAGPGRRERPHVLTSEPPERAGHDGDLPIKAEHLREQSISHLVTFQLFTGN